MDSRATLKDVDLQAHYDLMFELFASPGWKRFVEEAERFAGGVNQIGRLQDDKGLYFAKGQMDVLGWIIRNQEMTEKAYEVLLQQDAMPDATDESGE